MASLPDSLRRRLENTVIKARDEAEDGARAALKRLAVGDAEPHDMTPEETELRTKLRAHARQLGDPRKANGAQEIEHLVSECAYQHWHRMLFARFLAENQLLIHSDHEVPVTLAECEELAAEAGVEDGWSLAARFAARMLPAIFRPDDPVLFVRLAPEHLQPLEKLLADLPVEVFTADDGLGWVYQFWQSKRKKAVNKSGVKIGADELPVVTQLFTEPYMVQFLLHNTLGAWWAGKVLARQPDLAVAATGEEELRAACALPGYAWTYLRFIHSEEGGLWRPAAGTFDGWPERAVDITVLDPCCGSGHFLVEAFRILVSLRKTEEDLSAREACAAVLRDNLFGLEIDERCTQIAAFNLALSAWTYPGAGGYRYLPELNIACSGISVGESKEEWAKLAPKSPNAQLALRWLNGEFQHAPVLGSLLDPGQSKAAKLINWEDLQPLLEHALAREEVKRDAQATEAGIAAQGISRAAALLSRSYRLVVTNVPYLGRGKQASALKHYADDHYEEGKKDLSTAFVLRCLSLCGSSGSVALVTPQNWLLQRSYTAIRHRLLRENTWRFLVALGEEAWQHFGMRGPKAALAIIDCGAASADSHISALDASGMSIPQKKESLQTTQCGRFSQKSQYEAPDHRLTMAAASAVEVLSAYADSLQGIATGDYDRFGRCFWETHILLPGWVFQQSTVSEVLDFGGREHTLLWEDGRGELARSSSARIQGLSGWRRAGVAVSQMRYLPVTRYTGEAWDNNTAVIVPRDPQHLSAIWTFCTSAEFVESVRRLDNKVGVTNATLTKVPFDLAYWQKLAAERYPTGLPEPESADPTQWLFHGHPEASTAPLPVAVARLLGYRWPAELNGAMRLSSQAKELVQRCTELQDLADVDGIVCIPPVRGEQPAAERLQRLLAQAFGAAWTPAKLPALLEQVEFSGKPLDDWLRDGFFEQHYQLFQQRPFIWHIWDGRKRDGFAALVNYHKLDRKLLERLTYTVLGDWITQQRHGMEAGELGAEDRLAAAEILQRKLTLILEGEPPYDIFVRWKSLNAQPIGWDPDLNDGVRINIRPFVKAGVLRKNPRIKWTKDRGGEPASLRPKEQFPWFWKDGEFTGERVNDFPLTNAQKRAARAVGGR